jgi:hypothetical protein
MSSRIETRIGGGVNMPFDGNASTKADSGRNWRSAFQGTNHGLPRPIADGAVPAASSMEDRERRDVDLLRTLQLLTVARTLIADRKNWTEGCYETYGRRRCAVGAVCVAAELLGGEFRADATDQLRAVALRRGYANVEAMNDTLSHDEILTAFDEAIALATERFIRARTAG